MTFCCFQNKRMRILLALLVLSVCTFLWWNGLMHPVSRIIVSVPAGTADAVDGIGLAIVAAARSQVGKTVKYDSSYADLNYPMGDIPIESGVCTDVIIRALRDALGMDLQQLVHEDMNIAFDVYPKQWGLEMPDRNIDHRRVPNLMRYFERKGFSIPISSNYLPGDIVTSTTFGRFPHIMIVSDRKTKQGFSLVIHNANRGAREEKGFSLASITGHYRIEQFPNKNEPSTN